jgi:hypothetical protein
MVPALLAILTAVAPPHTPPGARVDGSPIRVSLNSGAYFRPGDRARVRVRTERDGYLVVLRADVAGRVRVLFPLDPGDDDFVRGDKEYTLAGRGDRETFIVDDQSGSGTILAAFSLEPFQYDQFVLGDHWDYRVLTSDRMRDDPEAGLLDLATAMANSAHFDYDVIGYTVSDRLAYGGYGGYYGAPCFGCRSGFTLGIGMGYGFGYGRLGWRAPYYGWSCDPYWDPFGCDPWFYDPFFGFGYSAFYYPWRYNAWRYGYAYRIPRSGCYYDPFCFGGRWGYPPVRAAGALAFKRTPPPPPLVLPRQRGPGAAAGVAGTRPRVGNADPRSAGGARARPAETRRRTPPPAARPAPTRRGSSPAARPSTGRKSSPPPARPRSPPPKTKEHNRASAYQSWRGPYLSERGRTTQSLRERVNNWSLERRGSTFSMPGSRSRSAPRPGGIRFSVPSVRGGIGSMRAAPRVSRPAPAPRRR